MIVRIALAALVCVAVLVVGIRTYFEYVANPRVTRELMQAPDGERARRVMLLELPSGRVLPVNYLRERDRVYAAADGRWWRELDGAGFAVSLLVRGEKLAGSARAVRDDPDYTERIFARLRPDALEGFGTLIEIRLEGESSDESSDENSDES
jgi:hypothetical protein